MRSGRKYLLLAYLPGRVEYSRYDCVTGEIEAIGAGDNVAEKAVEPVQLGGASISAARYPEECFYDVDRQNVIMYAWFGYMVTVLGSE